MAYIPKRNLSPDELSVCHSLAVVMGLEELPPSGWDREELIKVGTTLFKRFKSRATLVQMILCMNVVTERRQVGDYLTPNRAYWYMTQRLADLTEKKTNPLQPEWQEQIARLREV